MEVQLELNYAKLCLFLAFLEICPPSLLPKNKNLCRSVEGLKGTVLQPQFINLLFPSPVGDDDSNPIA